MKKHSVEMPESFLMTIATHGNLGDGDLPRLMQIWAENECKRLNITDDLLKMKHEKYKMLKEQVSNLLGSDTVERIEKAVSDAAPAIKSAVKSARV